ncbi:TRAP transporter substrate-binding protein [Marinobacterium marinum]|uniref:TRAP transporter substrate-binding protein n=1 Tax=Marinobacterium marinum TaxID=2756129 RepID=A0A7W2AC85_9GAMM|nr:TRAP transporter substrate-binding protein [Marinobacterium marinum]MBA4502214.1 TRAP transporter substrate-binding protein [Marinobacterium marinum]
MNIIKTIACFCALLIPTLAYSQTTLRVATWLPPTSGQNDVVWPTWAKWVEDATEGRVKIELEYGSGHPKSMFGMVEDGVADVSFGVNGYLPGRFKLPAVVEIPAETSDPEALSVALWRVYLQHFESAGEFDGLKVLGMFVHGPGQLFTTFEVNDLADIQNKKIRTGGGVVNDLATRLGVVPVFAPVTKVYEMMQQGVIDGVFLPTQELKYSRLNEVVTDVTLFPSGMYTTAFTIFMNPDVFDDLSVADQQAIMSVSGEKLSALAGRSWGASDAQGLDAAKELGVRIKTLSVDDPITIAFGEKVKGMHADWIASVADRPIDAQAALDDLMRIAREYAAAQD